MDRGVGLLDDDRLGAERHPQSRGCQHPQVVGTVPDGDGALHGNSVLLGPGKQAADLLLTVHDPAQHPAGEHAVVRLQTVGRHMVDTEALGQGHHHLLESS